MRFKICYNATTKVITGKVYEDIMKAIKEFERVMNCTRWECWFIMPDNTLARWNYIDAWLDYVPSTRDLL